MANVTNSTSMGRAVGETSLLLPDGRDARGMDFHDLWKQLVQIVPAVPDLDQAGGKNGLLEAYARYLWAALLPKLSPTERALVLGKQ